jgi:hypothetical protein
MKNDPKELLSTKIKDLTPEILAQLEKPLGTSDRPFPMWGSQRVEYKGKSDLEQVLSVIASDALPMKVYSERSYQEVMALAYCDMPVPSMLQLFFDGLERRKPESKNRTQMLIGNPGHGKSFMGGLQGRLRSKKSVEVFDCGGKNMNELLFEMVLDFGAGDALPKAIDKRLKAGALQALSYGKLKQLPAKAITADKDGNIESIDWNYFKSGVSADEVDAAFKLMKEVSHIEGLDNAGGNALGMNSQYGPLIRWFKENREGVLDEYNKSREGSDNALQTVWQFLNGEIDQCTVENPLKNKDTTSGPSSFTFKREDMGIGFFVTLTGNKTEDGVTTRSLNKSVYSRLSPQTLPDPDVIDWQHRICQMMVGLPVSTLYAVFKDQANKDPDAFGAWLMALRKEKAQIEGVPVPALQEALLMNWKNVVSASEKLAQFYDKWATLTDAEKIMQGHADLVEEVDEEYSKKEGVDFRKIKQHLEEAAAIRPRMEPAEAPAFINFKDFMKQPVLNEQDDENPALFFGTRLVEFLERMVYEKSAAIGKEKLYAKLSKAMDEFGLHDVHLLEGAHSGQKSVEEALNISSFADRDLAKQAQLARKVFCDYIRQISPEITAEDDQIVTMKKLHDALEKVSQKNTAETKELFVVNRDHETLGISPLKSAKIEDVAAYTLAKKELDLSYDDLVHHDDFMASLALPTISGKNIAAIWDSNIRPLTEDQNTAPANQNTPDSAKGATADLDEALHIAENRSAQKLATTTLRVLFNDAGGAPCDVSIHIVRNEARGKTLIVGEKVPSKLLAAFREAGITHVDRNDPNAIGKVEAALNDLTRNMPESVRGRLAEAFKYRNDVDAEHLKGKNPQLSELLVDGNIDMMYGKYLIKVNKKAM